MILNFVWNHLFSFATRDANGLLLYNGRYNEHNDFLALEIIEGHLQFSYSLGANVSRVLLTYPSSVSDGNWHTVTVNYFNRVNYDKMTNIFNRIQPINLLDFRLLF